MYTRIIGNVKDKAVIILTRYIYMLLNYGKKHKSRLKIL